MRMAVIMTGRTTGATTAEIRHEDSGTVIQTVAPKDNGGDGSRFSPTDLCTVSLAACGATTMTLFARAQNIHVAEIRFRVEKHMSPPPRKIERIVVQYSIETACTDEEWTRLLAAAHACPVARTLQGNVKVEETFERIPVRR